MIIVQQIGEIIILNLILAIEDAEKRDLLLHLYTEYKESFMRYAYKLLKDEHMAEDIVQEVFAKLIENPAILEYEIAQQNTAYVFAMVKNHCLTYITRRKKIQPAETVEAVYISDLAEMLSTKENFDKAVEKANQLPDVYRDVIMLRYCNGLSDTEISNYLQISPGNARVRMHRALSALYKELSRDGEGD